MSEYKCNNVRELMSALERDYDAGNKTVVADEFESRACDMYSMICAVPGTDDSSTTGQLTTAQIREEQRNGRFCRQMYDYLSTDGRTIPSDTLELESVHAGSPFYCIDPEHKLLMRTDPYSPTDDMLPNELKVKQDRIYIPPSLRSTVIEITHAARNHNAPGGHPKATKMIQLCNRVYYWPNMPNSIRKWLKHCGACNLSGDRQKRGTLHGHVVAQHPRQKWMIDLIEMPKTDTARYCLTAIDVYS